MPPDEYHHQVNNSVYTNLVAKLSLELPGFVDELLGQPSKQLYKDVANSMNIPFDKGQRYHPEYEGYVQGQAYGILKQTHKRPLKPFAAEHTCILLIIFYLQVKR